MAQATFALGCFWGPELAFRRLEGVTDVTAGYTGGHTENPSYRDVCNGATGHAEAVRIDYDPDRISYEELLEVFWSRHNPTTRNRQGPDVGEQYRSVIFYHGEQQKKAAWASKGALERSGRYGDPIVTGIEAVGSFYPAEEYHQRYLEKQGRAG